MSKSATSVDRFSELIFNEQQLAVDAAMELYRRLDEKKRWVSWVAPYSEKSMNGTYVEKEKEYSKASVEKLRSCRSLEEDLRRRGEEPCFDWFDGGDSPFDSKVSREKPDCLLVLRGNEIESSWATACAVLEFKSNAFGEKGQLVGPGHDALGQLFARRHRLHTPVFVGATVDRVRIRFACIRREDGKRTSPVKLSSPPPHVSAQEAVNLEIASSYDCLFWPKEGPLSLLRDPGLGEGELCGMEVLLGMRSQLKGGAFGLELSETWRNFAANLRELEPEYAILRPLSRIGSRRRDGRALGRYVFLLRKLVDDGMPCIIAKCWTEEERGLDSNEAHVLGVLDQREPVPRVPRVLRSLAGRRILFLSFGGRKTLHQQFQTRMTTQNKIEALRKVRRTLEAVHAAGYVHGDVKPENIVFANSRSPTLIDFEHAVGRGNRISGYTPAFCAQEIIDWKQGGEIEGGRRPLAKFEHDWDSFFCVAVKELTKAAVLMRSHFLSAVDEMNCSVFTSLHPSDIEIVRGFLFELRKLF